jgi:hypothetical protein
MAGTRPSGVYTAGTAQRFVNMEGYMPGKKVAIMGTGDIGLIMARRMMLEGAEVVGVFEIMPWVSGLRRNIAQCLDDFGIPYYLNHSVCALHGRGRLEGVTVVEVGSDRKPILGSEKFVSCDTLLLAVGLIPENELSRMAGIEIEPVTNGPAVNEFLQTSAECVFAAGNVVVVYDLVDFVSSEGERAGKYAARYAKGELKRGERNIKLKAGHNIRVLSPQFLTAGESNPWYGKVKMVECDLMTGDDAGKIILADCGKAVKPAIRQIREDGRVIMTRDPEKVLEERGVKVLGYGRGAYGVTFPHLAYGFGF